MYEYQILVRLKKLVLKVKTIYSMVIVKYVAKNIHSGVLRHHKI